MPLHHRRVVVGTTIATAMVVAFGAVLMLPPRQTEVVAVPANDASPEAVVRALTEALNAHDCRTASAVVTTTARSAIAGWCKDVGRLADVRVRHHTVERPRRSGRHASEEVARVGVRFTLDWRLLHSDVSMPEGPTVWGYLLVRASADAPWRVFEQGTG